LTRAGAGGESDWNGEIKIMKLVTVYCCFNPAEAQVIRSRLEAAGFFAQATHELSAISIEGYSMAAGGIEVQVPEDVAEEARSLLAAADLPNPQEPDNHEQQQGQHE
jgi:hypothetical protein